MLAVVIVLKYYYQRLNGAYPVQDLLYQLLLQGTFLYYF